MKNKITLAGICALLFAVIFFTAATTQQGKEKNNKNQSEKEVKGKKAEVNAAAKNNASQKNQPGNVGKNDQNRNNGKNDNNGKGKDKMNLDKDNNGKNNNEGKLNRGNDKSGKGQVNMQDGYLWDRETFKDRRKYKNQEKVAICHKFNGNNNEPAVTINVSQNALKAHMNHGDAMGVCASVNDSRFSDIFLKNRNDYYSNVQQHYEQVSYSQSILDYAIARLTNSRQQLATMQNSGIPVAQIESKQATVVQLEQNVSLLETLIGVAANIVAEKLQ